MTRVYTTIAVILSIAAGPLEAQAQVAFKDDFDDGHTEPWVETRLAQLEGQLTAASEQKAVERVRQLGAEYSQVEAELNTLLAAWTDVA